MLDVLTLTTMTLFQSYPSRLLLAALRFNDEQTQLRIQNLDVTHTISALI